MGIGYSNHCRTRLRCVWPPSRPRIMRPQALRAPRYTIIYVSQLCARPMLHFDVLPECPTHILPDSWQLAQLSNCPPCFFACPVTKNVALMASRLVSRIAATTMAEGAGLSHGPPPMGKPMGVHERAWQLNYLQCCTPAALLSLHT